MLRHELRDKSASFKLCQFKPDHGLNPETQAMYEGNILRVVPELVYSPYATEVHLEETGTKAKAWRIDLVLFLNGIPIVTMELKSEFKQAVENAIKQYKKTRLPKDPETNKPEPLLTFKRGALVHFAVSQYEAYMTTKLAGGATHFLPFNRGTEDGGAGNDPPEDIDTYATAYLWNEVLAPANILQIIGRFIHLGDQHRRGLGRAQDEEGNPHIPPLPPVGSGQSPRLRPAAKKAPATSISPSTARAPASPTPSRGRHTSSHHYTTTKARRSFTPSSW